MTPPLLPDDHTQRLERARKATEGLSVGDAFGEQFFLQENVGLLDLPGGERSHPPGPWRWTDDTMMALGIHEVLSGHGRVEQNALAHAFARRYFLDQKRGYGVTAHEILAGIGRGEPWHVVSKRAFDGEGSMGNGSAMRVAPVGAYFADDLKRVASEARASAEVTHFNEEAFAGAVAVAVATAVSWQTRGIDDANFRSRYFSSVLDLTPSSATWRGIDAARTLPFDTRIEEAAQRLGNGRRVTCPDTVPLCLWLAARHRQNFAEALWTTVSAHGDVDTNAAIVGGIVVMNTGLVAIPKEWLAAREELIW
jgi:ADP-ribosylglycohydrolase